MRQQIVEEVQGNSLQVDATIALIDNEMAQARELRGYLEDKRDRTTNLLNVSSIAAGGTLGVVSSALQLSPRLMKAGNVTGIVSGALVATVSLVALKAQKGRERRFHVSIEHARQAFRPAFGRDQSVCAGGLAVFDVGGSHRHG